MDPELADIDEEEHEEAEGAVTPVGRRDDTLVKAPSHNNFSARELNYQLSPLLMFYPPRVFTPYSDR